MSASQTPDYPTEYRGNTIYDEKKVRDLPQDPEDLQLVTGSVEVNEILDRIGVDHDPESVVLEDSYGCLWVDVEDGEYSEVWGIHKSAPYMNRYAVRLK